MKTTRAPVWLQKKFVLSMTGLIIKFDETNLYTNVKHDSERLSKMTLFV